jgi:hypothetical protein
MDIGPHTITNTAAPESRTQQTFAAGVYEAITVPDLVSGQAIKGVIIIPPTDNTGTILLKGATGDVGVSLGKTDPFPLPLFSTTNLGLLCSANTTLTFDWF